MISLFKITKLMAVACSVSYLLSGCQGVDIEEGSKSVSFVGAESVDRADSGAWLLNWTKAEAGGSKSILNYEVRFIDYGINGGDAADAIGFNDETIDKSNGYWTKELSPEISPATAGQLLSLPDEGSASYVIDLAMKVDHVYGFQVRAENEDGEQDKNFNVVLIHVKEGPSHLGCLEAKINEYNYVVLAYDFPDFAKKMIIKRNSQVVSTNDDSTVKSFTDSTVVQGNSYTYECIAEDAQENIIAGDNLGVVTVPRKYTADEIPPCTYEGQIGCVTTVEFPSVNVGLLPSRVVAGTIVSGVTGTASLNAVDNCSLDGQKACITSDAYPAAEREGIENKLVAGYVAAGVTGQAPGRLSECSTDGEVECSANTSFKAAKMANVVAANVKSGVSIAGVAGSLTTSAPVTCSADAQINCVANNDYRAALVSGMPAKVISGQSVAGVAGSAQPRAADCSLDGETGCTANSSYPAADLSVAIATNIRNAIQIGGVTGTLTTSAYATCSSDGEINCSTDASFPAVDATGLAAKVIVGQAAGGTAGAASPKAPDCNNYSQQDCTATASFPSRYLDCSSDGETTCTTVAAFKAVDMSNVLAVNIKSGITIGAVAGTLASAAYDACTSAGELNCSTTVSYPAALDNCVAENSDGTPDICRTTATYQPVDVTSLASRVVEGQSVAFVTGTALAKRVDCSADGEVDCTAVTAFKAADMSRVIAANIKAGVPIAGITGDYPSATYKLASDTATTDLPTTWPPAAGTYEWFDATGAVQSGIVEAAGTKTPTTTDDTYTATVGKMYRDFVVQGDSDLVATNIKTAVDIFGVVGNINGTNSAPTISITAPTGGATAIIPSNGSYISFTAIDSDSEANVTLYYKTANTNCDASLTGWTEITNTLTEGSDASYFWTIPATDGVDYYICAKIDDGINTPAYAVSSGYLDVGTNPAHDCTAETNGFISDEGGCKYGGLVWSNAASATKTWDDAIWDSTLSGNAPKDSYDPAGFFNDYDGTAPTDYSDSSTANYCHDLVEGGFYDWRMPTKAELVAIRTAGAPTNLNFTTNAYYWSGKSYATSGSAARNKYYVDLSNVDEGYSDVTLGTKQNVVCVRGANYYVDIATGTQVNQNNSIPIPYVADDGSSATTSFYYNTDQSGCSATPTGSWTAITAGIAHPGGASSYSWAVGNIATTNYYICMVQSNGLFAVSEYPIQVQ